MKSLNQTHNKSFAQKFIVNLSLVALIFTSFSLTEISQSEARPSRSSSTTSVKRTSSRRVVKRRSVKRKSTQRVKQSSVSRNQSRRQRMHANRGYGHSSYRGSRSRHRTVVRHRPYYPNRSVSSSSSGFMNSTLVEFGGQVFSPIQGQMSSGMHFGIGRRLGPVAGLVEAQLAQNELGTELKDLNAQLRIYLPINSNMEIFPMFALGQSYNNLSESGSHLDLGIGVQLNLSRNFAIGGRYSARMIAEEQEGMPTNGHNLLGQISFRF
jgi:hypothetical protein